MKDRDPVLERIARLVAEADASKASVLPLPPRRAQHSCSGTRFLVHQPAEFRGEFDVTMVMQRDGDTLTVLDVQRAVAGQLTLWEVYLREWRRRK